MKKGGSPTALEEWTMGVRWQGESRSSETRKSIGMSFAVGILYVPAHTQSSIPSHVILTTVLALTK